MRKTGPRKAFPHPVSFAMHKSTIHRRRQVALTQLKNQDKDSYTQSSEPILFPKLRIYFSRLPLPTLFYKLEAANLGDLMRLWVRTGVQINVHLWLFKDSWRHTKHVRKQSALPTRTPSSSQSVFRAPRG